MENKKETNSEGKSAVVIIVGIVISSIYGPIHPDKALIAITVLTGLYMAARALIKASLSKKDDEILAKIESIAEQIVSAKK